MHQPTDYRARGSLYLPPEGRAQPLGEFGMVLLRYSPAVIAVVAVAVVEEAMVGRTSETAMVGCTKGKSPPLKL